MDNYSMYIGPQRRDEMNERRLDAAHRRQSPYKHVAPSDMFTELAEEAVEVMSPMTAKYGMPMHDSAMHRPMAMKGQEALMEEMMMQDFEAHELALYLNTHPNDTRALEMHREASARSKALRADYERRFGPVSRKGIENWEDWTWSKGPWPWEQR